MKVEPSISASNEIYPHAECSLVRELISDSQQDLDILDSEITQTQQNLANLVNRRSKNAEYIARLRARIAPHKYLPPELLANIFIHCLDGKPVEVLPSSFTSFSISMPWVLGRVCSRWRTVSLEECRLWRNIHFGSSRVPQAAVQELLSRSGNLAITFNADSDPFPSNIFATLLHNSKRFRSLALPIEMSNSHPLNQLSSFANLKSLTVLYHNDMPHLPQTPIAYSSIPTTLQQLELLGCGVDYLPFCDIGLDPSTFPWGQLSHLYIYPDIYILPTTMLTILRQCATIIECSTSLDFDDEDIPYSLDPITVPSLQSLTINSGNVEFGTFLDALTLPSLKTLTVGTVSVPPWQWHTN